MAGIPQQTDPWEISFNKNVEYTVAFRLGAGAVALQTVTYGQIITNLLTQQPILSKVADHIYAVRILAAKIWGYAGGDCQLIPGNLIGNGSTLVARSQHFDAGDGVRRPTVDYSWPNSDQDWVYAVKSTSTIPVLGYYISTGVGTTGAVLYVRIMICDAVSGAITLVSPSNDLKTAEKRIAEQLNFDSRVEKVKRLKAVTAPIINE